MTDKISHLITMNIIMMIYSVFIKYCVFSLRLCDFLNSDSSAAALVFYLPAVCTHSTHTDTEGKQRKGQSPKYLKKNKKKHNI